MLSILIENILTINISFIIFLKYLIIEKEINISLDGLFIIIIVLCLFFIRNFFKFNLMIYEI